MTTYNIWGKWQDQDGKFLRGISWSCQAKDQDEAELKTQIWLETQRPNTDYTVRVVPT